MSIQMEFNALEARLTAAEKANADLKKLLDANQIADAEQTKQLADMKAGLDNTAAKTDDPEWMKSQIVAALGEVLAPQIVEINAVAVKEANNAITAKMADTMRVEGESVIIRTESGKAVVLSVVEAPELPGGFDIDLGFRETYE